MANITMAEFKNLSSEDRVDTAGKQKRMWHSLEAMSRREANAITNGEKDEVVKLSTALVSRTDRVV